jgi:hypothetical protein
MQWLKEKRTKGKDDAVVKRKKDKRKKNYLQNITQKTKDRATHIPPKTGEEFRCFGRVSSSCSISNHYESSNEVSVTILKDDYRRNYQTVN